MADRNVLAFPILDTKSAVPNQGIKVTNFDLGWLPSSNKEFRSTQPNSVALSECRAKRARIEVALHELWQAQNDMKDRINLLDEEILDYDNFIAESENELSVLEDLLTRSPEGEARAFILQQIEQTVRSIENTIEWRDRQISWRTELHYQLDDLYEDYYSIEADLQSLFCY